MKRLFYYFPLQRVASILIIVGGVMLVFSGKAFPASLIMIAGAVIASFSIGRRRWGN